jgi:hypothetical protein
MSDIINDNGVVGMTRQVTLSLSGVTVLDDFKLDVGTNAKFDRTDNNSKTTGTKVAKGPVMGTATAQLANASVDPIIFWGQTFTEAEGTFFIYQTGRAESKNGETKAAISFQKAAGSVVVT